MKSVLTFARSRKIPVYYSLHQTFVEGQYSGWEHMTKLNAAIKEVHVFVEGFGCTVLEGLEPVIANGDVVASKHWNMNGFQNTDLDHQLRQHNITHLVLWISCDTTTDATAAFDIEAKEISIKSVWPRFTADVTTTEAWIKSKHP